MPKMSDAEIERFIASKGLVRLASVGADGWPTVAPLGYLYRNRMLYITARERSAWLENVRNDPRICASIDEPRYPLNKVTIKGIAEIVHESGRDDEWRDLRMPLRDPSWTGPEIDANGAESWNVLEAYATMTFDEPRVLVAIPVEGSKVTSWRMALDGDYLDASWARKYYHGTPQRYRVVKVGDGSGPEVLRAVAEVAD